MLAYFFVGIIFLTQKQFNRSVDDRSLIDTPPQTNMRLPVITNMKDMKEKKLIKTNIGLGSVVKEKFAQMEWKTRDVRFRRMRKGVVVGI